MHAAEDFILALRAGFMHQQRWGTLAEYTASDLGIGIGDAFDIELGGPFKAGHVTVDPDGVIHLPLPEGAVMVSIREYYFDWTADEPATFTIECLDTSGDAPRVTAAQLVERFDEAAAGVEHSMRYWNTYMIDEREARVDNSFAGSLKLEKGLAAARYAFCFWNLAADEALLIDTDLPHARYWSFQLYVPGWFETVDPVTRITSRNHTQAEPLDGNRIQMVVSSVDPGAVNWLDTGGRSQGLCTLRWFWPEGDQEPMPAAKVVALGELGGALDPASTQMTPIERAAELAARRTHLAWRFRV
jgi:hypothetical protein